MTTILSTAFQRFLPQPANLCQYCSLQPRFQNHPYCSKTCANEAALLCNRCQKKPKFQNFEYCSRTCASLANQGRWAAQAPGRSKALKGGNKLYNPKQTTLTTRYDPTRVPNPGALQQSLQSDTVPVPNDLAKGQKTWIPPFNNQHFNLAPSVMTNAPSGNYGYGPSGEPVYVGGNGSRMREQSAMRPRGRGMASNLGPPCIMCLDRPQRESDYFCSKGCKDDSSEKFPRGKISDPIGYE